MWQLFSEEEFKARVTGLQQLMAEQQLDLMLLTQKENVEYWTGYMTIHWQIKSFPPAIAAVPAKGRPMLIVPGFLCGLAEGSSSGCDIVGHPKTHAFPHEMLGFGLKEFQKVFSPIKRVAVESGNELKGWLSYTEWMEVVNTLKGAEFIPGGEMIWKLRMKKSPRELDFMGTASMATVAALTYLHRHVKPGWTEVQVGNTARVQMLEHGADEIGFINYRSGPSRYKMSDTITYFKPLEPGDMAIMDGGAKFRGYWSDMSRVASVGEPTKRQKELYRVVAQAQRAGIDAIKPGVTARDVFRAVNDLFAKAGWDIKVSMCGHGIGLDLHEPPVLCEEDSTVLEPGMVLTVEPWIHDVSGEGVFGAEDLVVVTERGNRVLSDGLPREELWAII